MGIEDRWLLPDGVEDVLPSQARRVEAVRRGLLDLYADWGYEYVIPPMIEYLESLLTGTGRDLDLKTFKVVDLVSGRMMGVRADITPQVARIDAHSLNREGPVRLCYAGTVLQAKADSQLASRTPLSVGAELFGDSSSRADLEIVSLMVESLSRFDLDPIHVDLGDVSVFRQFTESLELDADQVDALFTAVQRKSAAEIRDCCSAFELDGSSTEILCTLPLLTGDESVLDRARELFRGHKGILQNIENLAEVAAGISERFDKLDIYFDLSELRGYAYHTGIVFAAYVNGSGRNRIVAKGGRYDHIGQVFGRQQRGATGFSVDVRNLVSSVAAAPESRQTVVVDPAAEGSAWEEIQRLRGAGYVVVESGSESEADLLLTNENGSWQLKPAGGA